MNFEQEMTPESFHGGGLDLKDTFLHVPTDPRVSDLFLDSKTKEFHASSDIVLIILG